MNKSATRTYLWADAASTTDSADMTTSYSRLQNMALAYVTYGSTLRGNASLLTDLIGAMDWMNTNRYNAKATENSNWWDWQIGTPTFVDNLTALLYNQLSATQISNYMAAVDRFTPTPQQGTAVGSGGSPATGANLVWQAQVVGVRACLVKNSTKLSLARDALSGVFPYVTNGDGFYVDGSFIQHTAHPYNGGYGASLLGTITPMLSWLSGSSWAVTDPLQTNVYQWVYTAFEPFIYQGAMMDMERGRGISRGTTDHGTGQSVMETILAISQFAPSTDAARMRAMVKYWTQTDTTANFVTGTPLTLMPLAEQLMADTNVVPRGEVLGHYTFADSDRVVHLGAGYGLGLAMSSSRIYNYESINSENLHGWFTGDGMTYLYNANLTAFSDNYWPTVNPRRLPGITVDAGQSRADASGQAYLSTNAWVGGATLDRYGAAGMQLKSYGNSLVAQKSWFMFDDEIVCLGAGISSTDNRPIETIVENRKLSYPGGAEPFTVNGVIAPSTPGWSNALAGVSWAHLAGYLGGDDIGYYFPQPVTLQALREARTGSWSDINAGGSTNLITRNYLTLWFAHGNNPVNATYAYALLPNRSAREVEDYAASPQFTVLANTPTAQAVQETTLGITAANFWNDGSTSAGGITVNRKASVLVRNDGNFLDVAISDPTQTNSAGINVTINVAAAALLSADAGVTLSQTSPQISFSVATAGASGKTFKARFYLRPPVTAAISPVADTYAYDAAPTNNYGTSATMAVKLHAGSDRESFLKFDLTSLPAGTVGAASLNLFCNYAHLPGVHVIATVPDNSWTETGLTWSNKPASLTDIASWTPPSNAPVSVPVASAVQAALAAGSNFLSFRIYSTNQTGDGYVDYLTREAGTVASRPQLVIAYTHNPPSVSLSAPAAGAYLSAPGTMTLTAQLIPGDGAVTNLAFYDDTNLLGSVTSAPYQLTASLAAGAHHFTAVATDANGLSGRSLPVFVSVNRLPTALALAAATPNGVPVDVDLRSLVSDDHTSGTNLLFAVSPGSNGVVSLLADGHTARFTPAAGYRGPASFNYQVTDTGEDARLLLHYQLQGNAADATPNGRAALVNVAGNGAFAYVNDAPAPVAPWLGQSLQLGENGTSGAVKLDRYVSPAEFNFQTSNWTAVGWCKRANTNNSDFMFHLGTGSGGTGVNDLQLRFDSGNNTVRFYNYNATGNDASLSTSASAGVWHHFAVVHNGAALALYFDGVLIGTDSSTTITADPAGPVTFGGNGTVASFTDRWFNGQFADLAIFCGALNSVEINRLAKSVDVAHFGGGTAGNTVAVQVLSNLELWRAQYFGSVTNAGAGADTADADGDGEANLLEFATGQNPLAATTQPLSASLAGGNLLVAYGRSKAALADGITFAIEAGNTLPAAGWSTTGITETVHADDGTRQTVWATVPVSGTSQRFVRLRVKR
jgi:hyaluronate lyase